MERRESRSCGGERYRGRRNCGSGLRVRPTTAEKLLSDDSRQTVLEHISTHRRCRLLSKCRIAQRHACMLYEYKVLHCSHITSLFRVVARSSWTISDPSPYPDHISSPCPGMRIATQADDPRAKTMDFCCLFLHCSQLEFVINLHVSICMAVPIDWLLLLRYACFLIDHLS